MSSGNTCLVNSMCDKPTGRYRNERHLCVWPIYIAGQDLFTWLMADQILRTTPTPAIISSNSTSQLYFAPGEVWCVGTIQRQRYL